MRALETKLHGLSRLDTAIPTQVAGRIRIAASDIGIPGSAQACAARIGPTHVPTVYNAGSLVGDANGAGKTRAPVIGNHIAAITRS